MTSENIEQNIDLENFEAALSEQRVYFGPRCHALQGRDAARHQYLKSIVSLIAEKQDGEPINILEIGSWAGGTAITWVEAIKEYNEGAGQVWCVDPWAEYINTEINSKDNYKEMDRAARNGEIYELFKHNIKAAGADKHVIPMRGTSEQILPTLNRNFFDIIFLDGDHRYEMMALDIEKSIPLLTNGGIICGDDLERQLHECDVDMVRQEIMKGTDYIDHSDTVLGFHPGVTLAVAEKFGQLNTYRGVWLALRNGKAWDKIELSDCLAATPSFMSGVIKRREWTELKHLMYYKQYYFYAFHGRVYAVHEYTDLNTGGHNVSQNDDFAPFVLSADTLDDLKLLLADSDAFVDYFGFKIACNDTGGFVAASNGYLAGLLAKKSPHLASTLLIDLELSGLHKKIDKFLEDHLDTPFQFSQIEALAVFHLRNNYYIVPQKVDQEPYSGAGPVDPAKAFVVNSDVKLLKRLADTSEDFSLPEDYYMGFTIGDNPDGGYFAVLGTWLRKHFNQNDPANAKVRLVNKKQDVLKGDIYAFVRTSLKSPAEVSKTKNFRIFQLKSRYYGVPITTKDDGVEEIIANLDEFYGFVKVDSDAELSLRMAELTKGSASSSIEFLGFSIDHELNGGFVAVLEKRLRNYFVENKTSNIKTRLVNNNFRVLKEDIRAFLRVNIVSPVDVVKTQDIRVFQLKDRYYGVPISAKIDDDEILTTDQGIELFSAADDDELKLRLASVKRFNSILPQEIYMGHLEKLNQDRPGFRVFKRRKRMNAKVSLILLDWDVRESFHILDYLSKQDVPREDFEVIIVEFFSRKYDGISKYESQVDTWVALQMPENCYYHKHYMYNVGIALAHGDIVTICDSDAMVRPGFIRSIVDEFDKNPNQILHLDQFRNARHEYYPFNFPSFEKVLGAGCYNKVGDVTLGIEEKVDPLHKRNYGACMCARREDVIAIGGSDEYIDYLGHICGPYDMTFRLFNSGKREHWHTGEFLYHTWHPGTAGFDNYLGPHDGRHVSITSIDSLTSGRVMPLWENNAIRLMRKGHKLEDEEIFCELVNENQIASWDKRNIEISWTSEPHPKSNEFMTFCNGYVVKRNGVSWEAELIIAPYINGKADGWTHKIIGQDQEILRKNITNSLPFPLRLARLYVNFKLMLFYRTEYKSIGRAAGVQVLKRTKVAVWRRIRIFGGVGVSHTTFITELRDAASKVMRVRRRRYLDKQRLYNAIVNFYYLKKARKKMPGKGGEDLKFFIDAPYVRSVLNRLMWFGLIPKLNIQGIKDRDALEHELTLANEQPDCVNIFSQSLYSRFYNEIRTGNKSDATIVL